MDALQLQKLLLLSCAAHYSNPYNTLGLHKVPSTQRPPKHVMTDSSPAPDHSLDSKKADELWFADVLRWSFDALRRRRELAALFGSHLDLSFLLLRC